MDARDIQRLLKAAGYYAGGLDGDFGPKSREAVRKVLERNHPEALKWSDKRRPVAAAQVILNAAGYHAGTVDGYAGHNTKEAYNAWDHVITTGRPEVLPGRSQEEVEGHAPGGGSQVWPRQRDVPAFFGAPGGPACTAGKVLLPFPFRIAWNKSQKVTQFSCHIKVATPLTDIFREASAHYGPARMSELGLDLFGGCFNYRPMRGGTALSMHASGIAVDLDPERNQLRWGRDRAVMARPEYLPWWKIVETHGAVSLGRQRNYDWMHFQFATL